MGSYYKEEEVRTAEQSKPNSCTDCVVDTAEGDLHFCVKCGVPLCSSCILTSNGYCLLCSDPEDNTDEEEENYGTQTDEGYGLEGM